MLQDRKVSVKSTVLEFRGEKIPESKVDFHTVMSMHMSRFPAALKRFAKGVEEGGS